MKTQSLEPDVLDQLFKLIRFLMRRPIYSIDGPGNGILDFDIVEIVRHRKSAVDVDIDADSLSVRAQRVNHCAFHSCGAYIWQKSALAAALDQKVIRREFFVQGDQRLGLEILNLKDRPAAEGVAVIDDGFHFGCVLTTVLSIVMGFIMAIAVVIVDSLEFNFSIVFKITAMITFVVLVTSIFVPYVKWGNKSAELIGLKPNTDIVEELRGLAPQFASIGNCVRPNTITYAVYQGYHAALDIH
jgi:hypothetical protein